MIHAVGPIWSGGRAGEEALLRSAYRSALTLAEEPGARSVTLPAISCGVYGYPPYEGARVAIGEVAGFLADKPTSVEAATFVLFSADTFAPFERALRERGA